MHSRGVGVHHNIMVCIVSIVPYVGRYMGVLMKGREMGEIGELLHGV